MCKELDKKGLEGKYNPKDFEQKLYENWEKKGYFKPSGDKTKKSYTIVMPPPNVTGKLHMGHALDDVIQDTLIRYKRMKGFNTLWIPGTDHAALATEAKVVEKLKKEGISKYELGREEFLRRAWQWKEEYGSAITNQVKKLGCSCDWTRERFTMDEGLSRAVSKFFVELYRKGLIYKGKRMINWCHNCNTSISDVEVEYEEEASYLWHIRYPVVGEKNQYIVVATTRPETMLGDTAIAVHPSDTRYKDMIGKKVMLPIMNKEIPIIADIFVDKEFGTGAVKITPAHDPNDYQAGLKHGLEIIEVFDENFKMGDLVKEYEGMDLIEAREKIVQRLKELDYLIKIEDYTHNVGKCSRCHHKIEPKISEQWFVKMEDLAKPAIKAVREKEIQFVPERYDKTYFNWMENIQDWCISRQIWWGHRIPAYYCQDCHEIMVEETKPEECSKCHSKHILQEEDTLDTWFSSALWPFSTLGWPEKTEDLATYYPTNTLVTAYDIITFWVSRMIVAGLELTKKPPFEHVLIHGIVRDSQGRKMSKSLGNGIDPLEVIDQYGTDSLRFSLLLGISPGNDIRYMPEKLEAASNFANKIWNASKFVLMNLEGMNLSEIKQEELMPEDRWILSRLQRLIYEVNYNMDSFELGVALQKIYEFIWNEFCDWYIEMVKVRLYDKENQTRETAGKVLAKILTDSLKLLHPFMPFVTEQIYTKLPNHRESIMITQWPERQEHFLFEKEERQIDGLKEVISGIRNVRTNMNVHPSKKSTLIFVTEENKELIKETEGLIKKLGFADDIIVQPNKQGIPENAVSVLTSNMEVFIPFQDLVDPAEELERLQKEKQKIQKEKDKSENMLNMPGFTEKAPPARVKQEQEKLEKYKEMLNNIEERMAGLK